MTGFCVWFTGLPCTGKTTLARGLAWKLRMDGYAPVLLDGDDVRTWLTPDCDFTQEGRCANVRRVAEVAKRIVDGEGVALVALVSPFAADREEAYHLIGHERVVPVHLIASEVVRHARDTRHVYTEHPERHGLYEKGGGGLELDTGRRSPSECLNVILAWVLS